MKHERFNAREEILQTNRLIERLLADANLLSKEGEGLMNLSREIRERLDNVPESIFNMLDKLERQNRSSRYSAVGLELQHAASEMTSLAQKFQEDLVEKLVLEQVITPEEAKSFSFSKEYIQELENSH